MTPRPRHRLALVSLLAIACAGDDVPVGGSDGSSSESTGTPSATTSPLTSTTTSATTEVTSVSSTDASSESSSGDPDTSSGGETDTGPAIDVACGDARPEGAQVPPPLPAYSGGTCPAFVSGWNEDFTSSGFARRFIYVQPADAQPDEVFPVIFLWHWLGGDPDDFFEEADLQNAADELRFVAIVPDNRGDLLFKWPFTPVDPDWRIDEELTFFDDLLACVAETVPIDVDCVSSAGVSAGALFTDQLASRRGQYLSSFISLSGGTSGLVRPWGGSPHIMPAMVLWGGPSDFCIAIDFESTSHDLETHLVEDGHPVLECVHNCGHSEPPFEPPFPDSTPFLGMWRFWLDHPYWLEDGESPWNAGVPDTTPEWCAMGVGNAIPREGECNGPGC